MMIIGCDFHTRYQQIAMMDEATGELIERRLDHESGEAHAFYRDLQGPVRVGIEATGPMHWFERLLSELGHELWIGDSAKIRASEVRKQKTDERDAALILDLLLTNRFPRISCSDSGRHDGSGILRSRGSCKPRGARKSMRRPPTKAVTPGYIVLRFRTSPSSSSCV